MYYDAAEIHLTESPESPSPLLPKPEKSSHELLHAGGAFQGDSPSESSIKAEFLFFFFSPQKCSSAKKKASKQAGKPTRARSKLNTFQRNEAHKKFSHSHTTT
jgi:hypothetical protein